MLLKEESSLEINRSVETQTENQTKSMGIQTIHKISKRPVLSELSSSFYKEKRQRPQE